jgi:ribonuclease HI
MRKPPPKDSPEVQLFADGACSGNPGPGGWAFLLRHPASGKQMERSGGERETTNNRMELTAVIEGLRLLKRPCRVRVVTDSTYVVKGMTEWIGRWLRAKWKNSRKEPVLNRDLWESLLELSRPHQIEWQWIKGHHGHRENERCDRLARVAIRKCT